MRKELFKLLIGLTAFVILIKISDITITPKLSAIIISTCLGIALIFAIPNKSMCKFEKFVQRIVEKIRSH